MSSTSLSNASGERRTEAGLAAHSSVCSGLSGVVPLIRMASRKLEVNLRIFSSSIRVHGEGATEILSALHSRPMRPGPMSRAVRSAMRPSPTRQDGH